MNERRFIRSPRRRGRAASWVCRGQHLGDLEVDDQLVLGGRLHRQVGSFFALEDTVDVPRRPTELIDRIRTIGNQAARGDGAELKCSEGRHCHHVYPPIGGALSVVFLRLEAAARAAKEATSPFVPITLPTAKAS